MAKIPCAEAVRRVISVSQTSNEYNQSAICNPSRLSQALPFVRNLNLMPKTETTLCFSQIFTPNSLLRALTGFASFFEAEDAFLSG